MSPSEYGTWLAEQAPPLTDEQVETGARILLLASEQEAAA